MYYPNEAIELWEGNRGIEEYGGEAFLVEERANGLTWMDEDSEMEDIGEEDEGPEGGSKEGSVGKSATPTLQSNRLERDSSCLIQISKRTQARGRGNVVTKVHDDPDQGPDWGRLVVTLLRHTASRGGPRRSVTGVMTCEQA